jgi:energy-coupling factor transporter ATP-binding protein EcfA2
MIEVSKLGKSYGARTLFENVSLKLVPGERYGLVGANGSGKTTFLEILAGDEPATEGSFAVMKRARLGVLRQDRFLRDEDPILDVTMAGDELVTAARAEQQRLVSEAAPDAARLTELEDQIAAHDGYTLEARATISRAWAFPSLRIACRSARCPAASSYASSWRRFFSAGPIFCFSTSRRTISTSSRLLARAVSRRISRLRRRDLSRRTVSQ